MPEPADVPTRPRRQHIQKRSPATFEGGDSALSMYSSRAALRGARVPAAAGHSDLCHMAHWEIIFRVCKGYVYGGGGAVCP